MELRNTLRPDDLARVKVIAVGKIPLFGPRKTFGGPGGPMMEGQDTASVDSIRASSC